MGDRDRGPAAQLRAAQLAHARLLSGLAAQYEALADHLRGPAPPDLSSPAGQAFLAAGRAMAAATEALAAEFRRGDDEWQTEEVENV